jgi:DtxR family transcriptional regulator, Mn-dependent transcriptional regulator
VTSAVEDYVKTIFAYTEWQPLPITSSLLATQLGLSPSSVTEMVKKLVAQGLVDHEPYGSITLTGAGETLALVIVRRHRLIETWLVEVYGYGWHEVHDEAEVLEHAVSDRLLDAIDERLGHPRRDPHGDLIPDADGTISRPATVPLGELAVGGAASIVRISDRYDDVLRALDALDAGVGSVLEVLENAPRGVRVLVDESREGELPTTAADAILMTADGGQPAG